MPILFNRDAVITVGDIVINLNDLSQKDPIRNQIRMSFKTNMHTAWAANTCDIKIYNLSQSRRLSLTQGIVTNKDVTVEAGYIDNRNVVFKGRTIQITHIREDIDWVTEIRCIDGRSIFDRKRVNISFGKDATLIDVVQRLSKELEPLKTSNMLKKLRNTGSIDNNFDSFKAGFAVSGSPLKSLFEILNSGGWEASIQNEEFIITQKIDTTGLTINLNEDTGLVGGVEVGLTGFVTAKALLNGNIYPTRRVKLNTELINNSEYKVNRVQHLGDTFGNEWYTIMDLIPIGR